MEKIGRNDPCLCGSGKKYKACCLLKKSRPLSERIKVLKGRREEKQDAQIKETPFISYLNDKVGSVGEKLKSAEEESREEFKMTDRDFRKS